MPWSRKLMATKLTPNTLLAEPAQALVLSHTGLASCPCAPPERRPMPQRATLAAVGQAAAKPERRPHFHAAPLMHSLPPGLFMHGRSVCNHWSAKFVHVCNCYETASQLIYVVLNMHQPNTVRVFPILQNTLICQNYGIWYLQTKILQFFNTIVIYEPQSFKLKSIYSKHYINQIFINIRTVVMFRRIVVYFRMDHLSVQNGLTSFLSKQIKSRGFNMY